jgi:hypothetical protein
MQFPRNQNCEWLTPNWLIDCETLFKALIEKKCKEKSEAEIANKARKTAAEKRQKAQKKKVTQKLHKANLKEDAAAPKG